MEPIRKVTKENHDSLIHVYQTFPSQREDIYPLFEKQYYAFLIKKSYRSEDCLQAARLALHSCLLTYQFNEPFMLYLNAALNIECSKELQNQRGYKYWSMKAHNQSVEHVAIDDPEVQGSQWIKSTEPTIEELLEEFSDRQEKMDHIKTLPNFQMIYEYLSIEPPKYSKNKTKDHSVYYEWAERYRHLTKAKPKTKTYQVLLYLRTIIRKEILNHRLAKEELPKNTFKFSNWGNKELKLQYAKEWYLKNKDKQKEYYRIYNKRNKK